MLENIDDVFSIVVLILIVLGSVISFVRLNSRIKRQEESDEFYRELL